MSGATELRANWIFIGLTSLLLSLGNQDQIRAAEAVDAEDREQVAQSLSLSTGGGFIALSQKDLAAYSEDDLIRQGAKYENIGAYSEAANVFSYAAEMYPGKIEYLISWGRVLNALIDYIGPDEYFIQEGYTAVMDAYDMDPLNAEANAQAALYNYLTDFQDDAVMFNNTALDIDLTQSTALFVKSMMAYDGSNFVEATVLLNRAIKENPENPALYLEQADRSIATGNYEAALQDVEMALELAPEHPGPWAKRGRIHTLLGNSGQAKQDFAQALKLNARYDQSLFPDGLPLN